MSAGKKKSRWGRPRYFWPKQVRDEVRDLRAVIVLFRWRWLRGRWTVRAPGFTRLFGTGRTKARAMGDLFRQLAEQTPDASSVMRERLVATRRGSS